MGTPMARNLFASGIEATVFNRSCLRPEALLSGGANRNDPFR